jgi:hypothetical protein
MDNWDVADSVLARVMQGTSDAGFRFEELLNLQPRGSMAKPYQVRKVVFQYKLGQREHE